MVAFPFFVSLRDAWHSPSLTLERLQKPAPIFRNPGRQPATAQGKSASWTVKRTFKAAMSKPTPSPLERAHSETNKLWRGRIVGELLHSLIHGSSGVCAFSHIGGLTTYCQAHQPEPFLRLEEPMQAALGYKWAVAQNGQWRSCQSGKRRKATILNVEETHPDHIATNMNDNTLAVLLISEGLS